MATLSKLQRDSVGYVYQENNNSKIYKKVIINIKQFNSKRGLVESKQMWIIFVLTHV